MPKSASYTLRWSEKHERYELQAQENTANRPLQEDWWFAWLAEHSSFSFQGKQGHLSLLKEPRARGAVYWYAYRSLNRRTVKQYAGRTIDLTAARLEELARALASKAPALVKDAASKGRSPSFTAVPERHEQALTIPAPVTAPPPQLPLLRYKLQPPRLHPLLIVRERLLEQLDSHLEGWAVGLRLLALTLRGHESQQDVEHHLANFAGSHRLILDYFTGEVLSTQSESLQDFLLRTSVLHQFSGALCDFLTGHHDSAQQLAEIERAGLFLEALDGAGEWFRFHSLFAEALRTEAHRRLGEDTLRALSAQARIWFEAQGRFSEAIEATLQAQGMQRAIILIGQLIGARPLHELQDVHTLLLWLQQIPEALLKDYPILCQHYAAALIFSGKVVPADFAQLEKLLQMAAQGWRAMGNAAKLGETQTFRAMIASRLGARQRALSLAREALTCLPAEEKEWRYISLGIVGMETIQEGQLNEAHEALQDLRARWEVIGNIGAMRGITLILGNIYFEQAALHKAEELFHQVLALAREAHDDHDTVHALQGLAAIAYERNELATAEQHAQEALDISKQIANTEWLVEATLFMARIEHARGQLETALRYCASLLTMLSNVSPPYTPLHDQLNRRIQAEQARFHLATGDHSSVQRWANSRDQHDEQISRFQREYEELIAARLLVIQGETEEAQNMLARLLGSAEEAGRMRSMLAIQLLQALAFAARKQVQEARRHLLRVLTQTHTEGFLRLFLDEGETMAALLHTLIPQIHKQALLTYVRSILHAFGQERGETEAPAALSPRHLNEPLSPQELRVLRLLVAGRSNREIAAEQVVSINTIRTQVRSIYNKLGVNNRVGASEMARQLHLL